MAILREEYHYNYPLIHWVFFLSALALCGASVWMIWDDYDRQWKEFQREAQTKLAEVRKQRYEEEKQRISDNIEDLKQEKRDLEEKIEKKLGEAPSVEVYETQLKRLKKKRDRAQKKYDQSKSVKREINWKILDTLRRKGRDSEEYQTLQKELEEQKKTIEENRLEVAELEQKIEEKSQVLKEVRRLQRDIDQKEKKLSGLRRSYESISPGNITNRVRNAPILDYASPTIKPEQVVLEHFKDDLHYTKVRKVDRCQTCHYFIDKPGFEDLENPYKTHPKLDVYLGGNSPHPMNEYGCTVCHEGRGRALHFARADHSTTDEAKRERWKEEYGWEKQEHWKHPMKPQEYIESSCRKCHEKNEMVPFAEDLNRGEKLVRRKGCYGCHKIKGHEDLPNPGPGLRKIKAKVDKKWMYRWIRKPSAFKHSRMPNFYGLSNDSEPRFRDYNTVEIRAITEYLWNMSETPDNWEELPSDMAGNAERGQELFEKRGCEACHSVNKPTEWANKGENWTRGFGFDLGGVSEKVESKEWLFNWIKNPKRYDAHARMPDLGLSDEEALHIATYLKEHPRFGNIRQEREFKRPFPDEDEIKNKGLDELIRKQLMVSHSEYVVRRLMDLLSQENVTEEDLKKASADKTVQRVVRDIDDPYRRKLVWLGDKMIRMRGCANCHDIKGMEDAGKVGAELSGSNAVGSKPLFMFAFGNLKEEALPHGAEMKKELEQKGWLLRETRWDWLEQKLKHPRSFDYGQPELAYRSKLKMPKFELTEEEVTSITTFLMGLTKEEIPHEYRDEPEGKEREIEKGKRIIQENNCTGCHRIGVQLRDVLVYPNEEYWANTFLEKCQENPDMWLGAHLWVKFKNPDAQKPDLEKEVAEKGYSLGSLDRLKQRQVTIVGEKGDYFDQELLEALEAYKYRRIPIYGWNEGTIQRRIDESAAHPPELKLTGKRIRSKWLFDFLKKPQENRYRRELPIRMPNFGLTDDEVLTLSRFFYYRNDEHYPYETEEMTGEITEEEHQIGRRVAKQCYEDCHKDVSPQLPVPKLSWAKDRLKPKWLDEMGWIATPEEQDQGKGPKTLEPGTGMAMTVKVGSQEEKRALIKYILQLTDEAYRKEIQEANGE